MKRVKSEPTVEDFEEAIEANNGNRFRRLLGLKEVRQKVFSGWHYVRLAVRAKSWQALIAIYHFLPITVPGYATFGAGSFCMEVTDHFHSGWEDFVRAMRNELPPPGESWTDCITNDYSKLVILYDDPRPQLDPLFVAWFLRAWGKSPKMLWPTDELNEICQAWLTWYPSAEAPACGLSWPFARALKAFLGCLRQYTFAPKDVRRLLSQWAAAAWFHELPSRTG